MSFEKKGTLRRKIARKIILRYTLIGIFLGTSLVLGSWLFLLNDLQYPLSFKSFLEIHRNQHLLFLIDPAPFVLGIFFYKIGQIQAKLKLTNIGLKAKVHSRAQEISQEKARTDTIFEFSADGMITFDEDGNILDINPAALEIFEYPRKETQGKNIGILITNLNWKDHHSSAENPLPKTSRRGLIQAQEFIGLCKDGTEIPLEVDMSRLEGANYALIIHDIRNRKRNDRLRTALQEVTEAVNNSQNLPSLYKAVHNSLSDLMDVSNFCIALYYQAADEFEVSYSSDEEGLGKWNLGLLRLALQSDAPLLLDKKIYIQLVEEGKIDVPTQYPASWVGVPLRHGDELIGVIAARSYEEISAYTDRDAWIMGVISTQVANAIDRERARESLRMSEIRYRRLVEEAGDIVYSTDRQNIITYMNPAAINLLGYSKVELEGISFMELVEPSYRDLVRDRHRTQEQKLEKEALFEFPLMRKSGESCWIEEKRTLQIESGEISGFQAMVHDVTERRLAEEALREREERFRSLSASSPIGVFQLDNDLNCVYTNKRFSEITGYNTSQCRGAGYLQGLYPGDNLPVLQKWRDGMRFLEDEVQEIRVYHSSGQLKWIHVRISPILDKQGVIRGFVGTFEDITNRKRHELTTEILYDISQALQETETLDQFYSLLHKSLDKVIDVTNFYIALYNSETEYLTFPYAREAGKIKKLKNRPLGRGLTDYTIRKGEQVLLDESSVMELYNSGKAVLIGEPAKSWLGVPLVSHGHVIGAAIIQSYTDRSRFKQEDVRMMSFVSAQIASAIERKRHQEEASLRNNQLAEAHRQIKEELALAARIQRARLPKKQPKTTNIDFGFLFNSCEEVAGDMFNFIPLDKDNIGVYVFDVSGHGVAAALLSMALFQALTATRDGSGVLLKEKKGKFVPATPALVAQRMNSRFPMNLETNQYFTMVYGVLNCVKKTFTFIRAGHPAPILSDKNGPRPLEEICSPAIGIIPNIVFEEFTVELAENDKIFLYTDGVDEAQDKNGRELGTEGFCDLIKHTYSEKSMQLTVGRIGKRIREFRDGTPQADDVTIVGFQVLPLGTKKPSDSKQTIPTP